MRFPLWENLLPLYRIDVQYMKQALINAGRWMIVMLFLGYYISVTSFYHTHYFSWGTVTHSHPYLPSGSETSNHSHTPIQCQTINLLSYLLLTLTVAAAFLYKTATISKIYIRVYNYKSLFKPLFSPLRAPPVFICK